jgi:hypothetical protein
MNKLIALSSGLALAFSLAAPVVAQQASAPTRADVKAERDRAAKAGEIKNGEARSANEAKPKVDKPRADVKAERDRAAKAGEIKGGEARSANEAKPKTTKARADVKAERDAAIKAGEIKADGEGRSGAPAPKKP